MVSWSTVFISNGDILDTFRYAETFWVEPSCSQNVRKCSKTVGCEAEGLKVCMYFAGYSSSDIIPSHVH